MDVQPPPHVITFIDQIAKLFSLPANFQMNNIIRHISSQGLSCKITLSKS